MSTSHSRLAYLDALRGFAIGGVVFAHCASLVEVIGPFRRLTVAAGTGVLLFFVISACTIFMTLSKGLEREAHPYRNFYIKRLMRLLPVYWIGIIMYSAVYGLSSRGWREGPELWHVPLHATLLNVWVPSATSSVVPGGWSISCEAMFYLTVPLWMFLARGWKSAALLTAALILAGTAITALARPLLSPWLSGLDPDLVGQWWYRLPHSQLGTFGFGIVLYFLLRDRPQWTALLQDRVLNLLVLLGSGILLLTEAYFPVPWIGKQFVSGLGFMGIALALATIPWKLFVNRLTCFIGRISYSAYLAHFLVLRQVNLAMPQGDETNAIYILKMLAISVPITIALAWLGFKLIEQPSVKAAKALIAHLDHDHVGTPAKIVAPRRLVHSLAKARRGIRRL